MSRLPSSRKQRRELHFARNVWEINEFKIFLGILNPVSAFGLNPFKNLHQSAVNRRQTFQSPVILEEKILAAFEQGIRTHSLEELIQLLEESSDHCIFSEVVEGKTLLYLACCMQPVKTLVYTEYNCDPTVQDNEGNTTLHEASGCQMPIVTTFIVPVCNPNILNSAKETPLHLALRIQHWRLRSPNNSHREVPLDGQGSTAMLLLVIAPYLTAITPVQPETKGILRPNNPESLRTSQLETVLEGFNNSSAVSLDQCCNLLADTNRVTLTEKLCNACFYSTEVSLRIGYFLVAIVLCLIVLILLLYYFS